MSQLWTCGMCTFQNEMFVDSCDMCMSAKTADCEVVSLGASAAPATVSAAPEPPKQKNHDKGEVLRELQRMFYSLLWGKAGCYEPHSFVEACSVLPLQYAVTSQNDFAEFYDHVNDVLADQMKGTPQEQAIGNTLSGAIVKQRYCHKCHVLTTSSSDQFIRLELGCLKNMIPTNSLLECLEERFSSEEMTGDNKVHCARCGENTDTTFMDTIDSLPNTLMLHLKRFSFDLETFQPKKLLHRIEFEHELDMWAYTRAGQAARLADLQAAEADPEGGQEETQEEQGSEGSEEAPEPGAEPEGEPQNQAQHEGSIDVGETRYKLQGVIVHRGHSAGGGHYYSFIKSHTDHDNVWHKFNDDRVHEIDAFSPTEGLDAECFGGQEEYVDNYGYTETRDKDAQAVALIYRRMDLPPPVEPEPLASPLERPASLGSLTPSEEGTAEEQLEEPPSFQRTRSSTLHSTAMARALSVPNTPQELNCVDPGPEHGGMSRSVPAAWGGFDRAMTAPAGGSDQGSSGTEAQWNSWRGQRLKEMMRAEVEQWGDNLLKQNLLFSEGVMQLGLGICQDVDAAGEGSSSLETRLGMESQVVIMGSLLFFDVCLRHDKHPELKEWKEVLQHLYHTHTQAAQHLLEQLTSEVEASPKKPWLEKMCLYHPDKNVRNAMCVVLRSSVSCVLGVQEHKQMPDSVAALVSTLVSKFQVATSTAIGIEAYCNVWATLAVVSNPLLRQHLLDCDVAAYLLHLYLQEASPAKSQLPEITVLNKEEEDSYCRPLHVVQQLLASVQSELDVTPLTLMLLVSDEFIKKVVDTNPDQLADPKKPLLRLMLTVANLSCEEVIQLLLSSLKPAAGAGSSDKMMTHRKEALLACAQHVGLSALLSPTYAKALAESEARSTNSSLHALFLLQVATSAAAIDLNDPELAEKLEWFRECQEAWSWAVEWLALETHPRNQAMTPGMDTAEARMCYQVLQHVHALVAPEEQQEQAAPEEPALEQTCLRVEGAGRAGLNTVYVFRSYEKGHAMWEATIESMYGRGYEEMYVFWSQKDETSQWHIGTPSTAFKGGYDRKWYTSPAMSRESTLQLPPREGWKTGIGDMGMLPAPTVTMVPMSELMTGSVQDGDQSMSCSSCGHSVCISKWYRGTFDDYQCPECLTSVDFPDKQLFEAAHNNDVEAMLPLLQSGECWIDRAHGEEGRTALHTAARSGHAEAVQLLLDAKCEVDPLAGDWTPLMNAAYHGSADKIQNGAKYEQTLASLLNAGASLVLSADSRTARAWAMFRGNQEILAVFEKWELDRLAEVVDVDAALNYSDLSEPDSDSEPNPGVRSYPNPMNLL